MSTENWWNDSDDEKRSSRRETCATASLSTINPTSNGLGLNPRFGDERQATNCLSHGTAQKNVQFDELAITLHD
jgi:hypothetical protein